MYHSEFSTKFQAIQPIMSNVGLWFILHMHWITNFASNTKSFIFTPVYCLSLCIL